MDLNFSLNFIYYYFICSLNLEAISKLDTFIGHLFWTHFKHDRSGKLGDCTFPILYIVLPKLEVKIANRNHFNAHFLFSWMGSYFGSYYIQVGKTTVCFNSRFKWSYKVIKLKKTTFTESNSPRRLLNVIEQSKHKYVSDLKTTYRSKQNFSLKVSGWEGGLNL